MAGFLPSTDLALKAWADNFLGFVTSSPTTYGLTAGLVTSFQTLATNFSNALAAVDPGQRSKSLVATKNAARTALKVQARLLANLVEGTASVTNAQKIDLGLNVRATPTPIPAPAFEPTLKVESVSKWTVLCRLSDSQDVARRGKPAGVIGAAVYSFVGPTPPASVSDWKFEGNVGKVRFEVNFSNTLAPGTLVWIAAQWFNGRKQAGPACDPVPTNVQGFSVSMAA